MNHHLTPGLNRTMLALLAGALCLTVASRAIAADPIPLLLPRPDGKPGDASKPVAVYILAGQSNMVGMGDLTGARPLYPSIFYTPDPAVIPGPMPVGSSAVEHLELSDAQAIIISSNADQAKQKPIKIPLGTTAATLPPFDEAHSLVVTATLKAPATGKFQIHPGFEDSSHNVALLDGKTVYQKSVGGKPEPQTVELQEGKTYDLSITYLKSGSAALWIEQIGLEGRGDLQTIVKKDGKFTWLVGDDGNWLARSDVTYSDARIAKEINASPLSATSNQGSKSIGPELGFGVVMGEFHGEQVLLIKTAMGNRSLGFDFRPPSSGRTDPNSEWESLEWRLMIEGVRKTLANLDKVVPGYQGQGYKIAGFGWFQGHKDQGSTKAEYEKHLVNLIHDIRKEFNEPAMPVVVATVGFNGYAMGEKFQEIFNAQMAVGDAKQHPEFAGTVASVDIRDFWREVIESPKNQDYHYNRNAETYLLIGDAMGRAMVQLKGGSVEARPASDRLARAQAMGTATAVTIPQDGEAIIASMAAIKPLILDGALVNFISGERNAKMLAEAVAGKTPQRPGQFPRDILDELTQYYSAAGQDDYQWSDFGPDIKNGSWEYFTFDPADGQTAKGYRKVALPAGMDNWFAPDFDAAKAGWKTGEAPFGQNAGKLEANGACAENWCRCGIAPRTLWDKEVLLMRRTVELPALEPGYRYRVVIGGASHVNRGEGYELYADGKLISQSTRGVGKREGGQPRGTVFYSEVLPDLADGNVTLAIMSFLQYKDDAPGSHLSVWIQRQKLPPIQ